MSTRQVVLKSNRLPFREPMDAVMNDVNAPRDPYKVNSLILAPGVNPIDGAGHVATRAPDYWRPRTPGESAVRGNALTTSTAYNPVAVWHVKRSVTSN